MTGDMYWILWPEPGAGWGAAGPYPTPAAAVATHEALFGPGTATGITIVHGPAGDADLAYAAAHLEQEILS